jgi:broad specificity phosphatase PhoE
LLKDGLAQWMAGVVNPLGMPSYPEFVAGITGALDHVRTHHQGHVLLVSSGGPIATAVGHVLGTSPEKTIELNLGIRNCSVTEFAFTPKRHRLVTFNTLPHLDAPEYSDWVTFA